MDDDLPTREHLERIADRLKALAEPTRLEILYLLDRQARCVNDLVERVGCTQANVSKHLAVLKRAGLVRGRREGSTVVYSLQDDAVLAVCRLMCGAMGRQAQRTLHLVGEPTETDNLVPSSI